MDEFGETPTIYVWPKGHEPGQPFPEDFWSRVWAALDDADLAGETA